jgi:hypothetical protein
MGPASPAWREAPDILPVRGSSAMPRGRSPVTDHSLDPKTFCAAGERVTVPPASMEVE